MKVIKFIYTYSLKQDHYFNGILNIYGGIKLNTLKNALKFIYIFMPYLFNIHS